MNPTRKYKQIKQDNNVDCTNLQKKGFTQHVVINQQREVQPEYKMQKAPVVQVAKAKYRDN